VILAGVEWRRLAQARPYVITRREWTGEGFPIRDQPLRHDVGGDLRVGLGSGFTLDATLNTDFALRDRDLRGFSHSVAGGWLHRAYHPPLGFVERAGILFLEGSLSHGSFPDRGFLQARELGIGGRVVTRRHLRSPETARGAFQLEGRRRGGGTGAAEIAVVYETLDEPFAPAPDATVPAGEYAFPEATIRVAAPSGWRIRGAGELSGGGYFDGHRITVALHPVVTFSRHLELAGSVERNRVRFPGRNERFAGDILRLRVRASANARLSVHGLVQHNTLTGRLGGNLRLRHSFAEGRDLYLVWNEAHGVSDSPDAPAGGAGRLEFRRLSVKYTHLVGW
jgi:hypothetical protein